MRAVRSQILTHKYVANALVPWQRISVDTLLIGEKKADARTPQWLVVIVDSFTRWTELYLILKNDSVLIAAALL
jgi:hypothetical protein